MLGSFPPKNASAGRWSSSSPNLQNDMWRIVGYYGATRCTSWNRADGGFDRERIEAFCRERGIALYDTAVEVIRLKDNASDNFLQVVREVISKPCWPAFRLPGRRHDGTEGHRHAARHHGLRRTGRGGRADALCGARPDAVAHASSSSQASRVPWSGKAEFYRKVFSENGIHLTLAERTGRTDEKNWMSALHVRAVYGIQKGLSLVLCINYTIFYFGFRRKSTKNMSRRP